MIKTQIEHATHLLLVAPLSLDDAKKNGRRVVAGEGEEGMGEMLHP